MAKWDGLWRITNERPGMILKAFKIFMWLTLALLLLTIVLTPFYLYFSEFDYLSKYNWQNNQAWGNFGSFIGGTASPILSLFTVIGIVFTYRLQQRQLNIANSQKMLGEIQPLLNATTLKIDSILDKDVDNIINKVIPLNKDRKIWSVYFCMMYLGGSKKGSVPQSEIDIIKSELKIEIAILCQEAETLSYLIEKAEFITNDYTISEFYAFKYGRTLKNMYDTGCEILEKTVFIFELNRED